MPDICLPANRDTEQLPPPRARVSSNYALTDLHLSSVLLSARRHRDVNSLTGSTVCHALTRAAQLLLPI